MRPSHYPRTRAYGCAALTEAMRALLLDTVAGREVWDLGAGRLELARFMARSARRVLALDPMRMPASPRHPNLTRIEGCFSMFATSTPPIDVAVASWPLPWDHGLERLLAHANTVVLVASNYDTIVCGHRKLYQHFAHRPVLHVLDHPKNSLVVYGPASPTVADRAPVPVEIRPLFGENAPYFDLETCRAMAASRHLLDLPLVPGART